jgi:hypothetical protein
MAIKHEISDELLKDKDPKQIFSTPAVARDPLTSSMQDTATPVAVSPARIPDSAVGVIHQDERLEIGCHTLKRSTLHSRR